MKTYKLGTVNDYSFPAMDDGNGGYIPLTEEDLEHVEADARIYFDQGIHVGTWDEVLSHYCRVASDRRNAAATLRSIPSEKRRDASRENGRKGGRPRKEP